jgi:hypothetical protein
LVFKQLFTFSLKLLALCSDIAFAVFTCQEQIITLVNYKQKGFTTLFTDSKFLTFFHFYRNIQKFLFQQKNVFIIIKIWGLDYKSSYNCNQFLSLVNLGEILIVQILGRLRHWSYGTVKTRAARAKTVDNPR